MKQYLTTTALTVLIAMTPIAAAAAETFRIAVGQPGRGYEARGKVIAQRIPGATVINFEGSDDISKAICSDDAEMGIMQLDAIYLRSKDGCTLQVVANYGSEFAFILFPPKSPHDSLHDLTAQDTVMADTIGSGSDLFWQNIRAIDREFGGSDKWTEAKTMSSPIIPSMATAMAGTKQVSAIIMVGNPNSQEVIDLYAQGWTAGDLSDKDINDLQFNGSNLYNRESVKIGPTGFMKGDTESVYVVPSYIVVSGTWMGANRSAFASVARAAAAAN